MADESMTTEMREAGKGLCLNCRRQFSYCGKPFTADLKCPYCGAVNVYENSQQPVRLKCGVRRVTDGGAMIIDGQILLEQASDLNGELLWGCKWFIQQLTDGVLVRDISKDYDPEWSMNMMRFVTALNRVNAAIFSAEAK